jgi:hypothetical protein
VVIQGGKIMVTVINTVVLIAYVAGMVWFYVQGVKDIPNITDDVDGKIHFLGRPYSPHTYQAIISPLVATLWLPILLLLVATYYAEQLT